jgi:hypothetical protein
VRARRCVHSIELLLPAPRRPAVAIAARRRAARRARPTLRPRARSGAHHGFLGAPDALVRSRGDVVDGSLHRGDPARLARVDRIVPGGLREEAL